MRPVLLAAVFAPVLALAPWPPAAGSPPVHFSEVAAAAGIAYQHRRPQFDPRLAKVAPWIGSLNAGVAVADVNGDGHDDIYLLTAERGAANALYLGDGHMHFTEAAAAFGLARVNDADGVSMDAAFADVDNDGDEDLFLVQYGRSRLFRNEGNQRFVDVSTQAGITARGNASCVLFLDADNDGWLDIMVGKYFPDVDLFDAPTTRVLQESFTHARNGGRNLLYHNNRDGTFSEIGASAGVDDPGWTLDLAAGDLDDDGDTDVYVANDFGGDVVYRNDGRGTFANVTRVATGGDFDAGMNADVGDFDNDGRLDVYVTNITNASIRQGNMLWRNLGDLRFVNVAEDLRAWDGGWGWGAKFVDVDNDGDLDILSVNGFVSAGPMDIFKAFGNFAGFLARSDVSDARSWPDLRGVSMSGYERTRLFENRGDGFADIGQAAGFDGLWDGRGIGLGDFDEDGDIDAVIAACGQAARLYRNDGGNARHWIEVRLRGSGGTPNPIGARLTLTTADRTQVREIDGGNGFSGQSSKTAHFGLGDRDAAATLTVRWPGGMVQQITGVRADRILTVTAPRPPTVTGRSRP